MDRAGYARFIAVTCLTLCACDAILGIHDRPVRGEGGGKTSSASAGQGGHGGEGGGTTTSSTAHAASSSSSSGGKGPTVPCKVPKVECAPNQVCCIDGDQPDRTCDECASPAADCGADLTGCDAPNSYSRLACDQDADCAAAGQVCCVQTTGGMVTGISCSNGCDGIASFPVCSPKQSCTSGGTCNSLDYDGYGYCM